MSPTTGAPNGRYTRREVTGRIEEANDDGLKIHGIWWNQSRISPLDLTAYKVNDSVYVCADETRDGGRRFIVDVEPIQTARPAPRPGEYDKPGATYLDDMPDEWPDEPASTASVTGPQIAPAVTHIQAERTMRASRERREHEDRMTGAERLECLRIAASVLVPGWTKKNVEPDTAVLFGVADQLVEWLYRADADA